MMPILTHDRAARIDEIAAEMDRRGLVIESLEARLSHIDGIYKGAIDNLNHHQRQLDADGVEVGVSRQALFEVLAGIEAAIAGRADNEATPASDGLPEGWKATEIAGERVGATGRVTRNKHGGVWLYWDAYGPMPIGPATMSLAEAARKAEELFPVVKAEGWVKAGDTLWRRHDGYRAVFNSIGKRWDLYGKIGLITASPTAEEAMAWADRERPVA